MDEPWDDFEAVTIRCFTAQAFLQELDETHDRWARGTWVYRGQNDASWDLIPSIYRDWDYKSSIEFEFKSMRMFTRYVNRVNLPVPGNTVGSIAYTKDDAPATLSSLSHNSSYGYQYDYAHVVFAMAQHSGIPTRLLDFSYHPLVAAYFAADISNLAQKHSYTSEEIDAYFHDILSEYTKSPDAAIAAIQRYLQVNRDAMESLPKEISVWAIKATELADITTLRLLDHPYSEILNLKAQMGVFICDIQPIDVFSNPSLLFNNELLKLVARREIWKLVLPFSERHALLEMLDKKRISRMYLMPSYEHVAKRVVESVE